MTQAHNPDCIEYTGQERAAYVCRWMIDGASMTTEAIAWKLGISKNGAYKLMRRLQRTALHDVDLIDHYWTRVETGRTEA